MKDSQPGQRCRLGRDAIHNFAGGVGGAVIDGDDFELRVVEHEQRPERGFHFRGFVAGRNHNGDGRQLCSGRLVPFRLADIGDQV